MNPKLKKRRILSHTLLIFNSIAPDLINMKKIIASFTSLLMLASVLSAAPKKDIVDTAVEAGIFRTLVAAVKAAGLVDTLKGEGPFTVFAPTDEAFAKLPKGTVATLLKPENKQKLVDILTYHVVPGKVKAKKAAKLDSAKTVNGSEITIKPSGKTLMINKSKVIKADIKTSNGIIHVIDAVLLPAPKKVDGNTNHIIKQAIHKGVPMFNLWSSRSSSNIVHESRQGCSRPMFIFSLPGSLQDHQDRPPQGYSRTLPSFPSLDHEKGF